MNSRKPISFIGTSRPTEAVSFYRDVLELELIEDTPFALVFSDGGQMLRVQKLPELAPAQHTVHGWQVTDIEIEIISLAGKGVGFLRFERLEQSPSGVWTSPDGHKVAWFKDPCGNNLSLTQFATGQ